MTKTYNDEMAKVRRARIRLLSDHPFWGDLAFGMPISFDDTMDPPSAMTDGTKIVFHPKLVNNLVLEELVFVLGHEVVHPALHHNIRIGNRDPGRWNVACDIVDNYMLVEGKVGKMPSFAIHDPDLYWRGNGKVEKIYELLPPGNYGKPGSGMGNGSIASMDNMQGPPAGQEDNVAADWRNKLQQAAQTAKKAGNLPGSVEAFVEAMTTPQVPWQQHLRNFMMTTRGTERTYAKRNRRYAATDIILPGHYGEKIGQQGIAIDCSGSTSDAMIAETGVEIRSIQEDLRPEKIHVFYFDTDVKKHEEYEPDEPPTIKAYGRGGTCFRTTFEYIRDNGIELENLIVATDLECHDYGPQPPFPVLWLVKDNPYSRKLAKSVPWGQVLFVD